MIKRLTNKPFTLYYAIVSAVFICVFIISFSVHSCKREKYHHYTTYEIYISQNKLIFDSLKWSLVQQIDDYIISVAPSSSLNGLVLLNNCLKYDIDICFVLSQAEVESHFGTAGIARKTNSVFNVFAFDGHSYNKINKNGKYRHPNDCVDPYMRLIKQDYLVGEKTEYDLLNNYVNKNGKRYASSEDYEHILYDKIVKIKNSTNIYNTYQMLLKQKLIIEM